MVKKLTNQQIIQIAIEMPWSVNPTTDLISAVRQHYKVSANVAGTVVSRVLDNDLIEQTYSEQQIYNPTSASNINSDPCWKMWGAVWQRKN